MARQESRWCYDKSQGGTIMTSNDTINVWFTNEQSTVYVGSNAYTLNHPRYHIRHNGSYYQYNDYVLAKNKIDEVLAPVQVINNVITQAA